MKYQKEELEKMSKEDLLKTYRGAKKSAKKDILTCLANSRKFNVLMDGLDSSELIKMAKIHPFKEVIVDTLIYEMELHGSKMAQYLKSTDLEEALQYKSILNRIKETFSRKPALPASLPKKIEQAKKLSEIEERRSNATGKKIEGLETQELDKAVDESRVEVNNGEMAKVFDRYAKEARKEGRFFGSEGETEIARKVKAQLTEEYTSILGTGKEDIAKLVAMKEFENYSGEHFYVPYGRNFFSKILR